MSLTLLDVTRGAHKEMERSFGVRPGCACECTNTLTWPPDVGCAPDLRTQLPRFANLVLSKLHSMAVHLSRSHLQIHFALEPQHPRLCRSCCFLLMAVLKGSYDQFEFTRWVHFFNSATIGYIEEFHIGAGSSRKNTIQLVILNSLQCHTTMAIVCIEVKISLNWLEFVWISIFSNCHQASVTGTSVKGLKGCKTLNKFPDPANPIVGLEEREIVNFPGFVDCIYLDAPNKLLLENGLGDTISIGNKNWTDAVLWNPHLQMEACYKDFVCVENAKIGKVELEPGQTWSGEQYLSIS
eukprot:Gb_21462 [translate_table: standard]